MRNLLYCIGALIWRQGYYSKVEERSGPTTDSPRSGGMADYVETALNMVLFKAMIGIAKTDPTFVVMGGWRDCPFCKRVRPFDEYEHAENCSWWILHSRLKEAGLIE